MYNQISVKRSCKGVESGAPSFSNTRRHASLAKPPPFLQGVKGNVLWTINPPFSGCWGPDCSCCIVLLLMFFCVVAPVSSYLLLLFHLIAMRAATLIDAQPPPAGAVGGFRHPFFVWGEGLEWRSPFMNVYPLSHRVLATEAFFLPSFG